MKVAIIASGKLQKELKLNTELLICADGGAEHAKNFGLMPKYIIGDFDSISAETLAYFKKKGVEIIHDEDQDSTDLQKALNLAQKIGVTDLKIYGAVGEELDHTLGNLLCLEKISIEIALTVFGEKEVIYRVCDSLQLDLKQDTLVSVIALTEVKGLTYQGLKWPVKNLDVPQNWLGTRNRATGPVEISVRAGQVLVMVAKL